MSGSVVCGSPIGASDLRRRDAELAGVAGVESVDVDLETKLVVVRGEGLVGEALVAAIDEAGYEASPA